MRQFDALGRLVIAFDFCSALFHVHREHLDCASVPQDIDHARPFVQVDDLDDRVSRHKYGVYFVASKNGGNSGVVQPEIFPMHRGYGIYGSPAD